MWRRVDLVWSDVSEKRIASIFRVEKSASEEQASAATCSRLFLARGFFYPEDGDDTFLRNVGSHSLQPPAQDGSSLADFSTLKIEAIRSSETSIHTRSTRRHIAEDGIV
jgi:hypothetical protein